MEPAPHKYNPNSAAAARAGSSTDATVLGVNSSFKRSAIAGTPLAQRMTQKGQMRSAAAAPQPKWTPRASSWHDAGCNWHEPSAGWEQSNWPRTAWQHKDDDAEMTDARGDNAEPWSGSAEPHVP